jgi:hypothetical protein
MKIEEEMRARTTLRVLSAIVVLTACAAAPASADLVGRWKLDEATGTMAADSSGLGHTATVKNGATWVPGRFGSGLLFDGVLGHVLVPRSAALEPPAVTAMAWINRLGSPGRFKYVIAKGYTACIASSYAIYTGTDGGLRFYVSDHAGTRYTLSADAGTAVWDGAWHHVAGTFDGAMLRLFVDGTEVGAGAARSDVVEYGTLNGDDLFFGRYPGCSGLDFDGTIDDVRIYDRPLAAVSVKAAMTYEFAGFFEPVNNVPTLNVAKAGSAIPVKFSLGGAQGLAIFAPGSPSSRRISCGTSAPLDDIETTTSANGSGLSYDAAADRYHYVWKTEKSWSGSCRELDVELIDGTTHVARLQFK